MKRHNMSKREGGKSMQRTKRMVLGLVAVFVLGGSLALLGCSDDDDDDATNIGDPGTAASVLGGRAFTFSDGTAFGIPPNTPTTVAFNPNATRFSISATTGGAARRATGAMTYASCTFMVGSSTNPDAPIVAASNPDGGGSNFPSGQGPQPNQDITASTCEVDNDTSTLTITVGNITATSNTPVGTGTGGFGG